MIRDMLATWWGPADRPGGVTARLWLPGVVFDAGRLPDGRDLVQVEGFTVEMHAGLTAPLQLPGPAGDGDPSRPGPAAAALLESLSRTAAVIAGEFLAWVRFRLGQYWVAPTGAPHPLDAVLSDAVTGEVIASRAGSPGSPVPFTMLAGLPGSSALDRPALRAGIPGILTAQATGDTGLPERLLSSAFGKLWSGDPDPQTAVFLAVVACETKVKTTLGTDVTDRGKPLLYYFDAGCRSATGHSLRQNGELWAKLEDLIATRNKVALAGAADAAAGRGAPGHRGRSVRSVRLAGFPSPARACPAAPRGNTAAAPVLVRPDRAFTLDDPDERRQVYEIVLGEARQPDDLAAFLNGGMLAAVWRTSSCPAGTKSPARPAPGPAVRRARQVTRPTPGGT